MDRSEQQELSELESFNEDFEEGTDEAHEEEVDLTHFLTMARSAYDQGQSFIDIGISKKLARNYSLAQSEHPTGSKYRTAAYANRSRLFRGKTEASIRKNEAAMAVAMFSHEDVTSISAVNSDDPTQEAAAKDLHRLVNHRLDKSVRWFLVSIGAYHEAMIAGDICSEQYWDYDENAAGEVIVDKPAIELYPQDNVRISPNAHWLDPVRSSPYIVIEIPMYVGDVKTNMENGEWIQCDESKIKSAADKFSNQQVKAAREGTEQAAAKESSVPSYGDFDMVFVRKNFIRDKGIDWFYFTLADQSVLSEPVRVHEAYPHLREGERPIVWGTATIEPHKVYRRSLVDRVHGAQTLGNEIANMRVDNVKQVLNKRKYATRNSGIDYRALTQSTPGGVVLMDDINAVKPEDTPDVTGSSYNEQNMLNVDFDELAGSFSNASVATNRSLNETVGGMSMLQGNANTLTEYQLRILVETWVEPVIRQVVQMVQIYEDDRIVKAVCGQDVSIKDLQTPVETTVSVGFGATDPQQKVQKLVFALSALAQVAPEVVQRIEQTKFAREIFGYLGFNDGKAFVPDDQEAEDPRIAQMMQEIQALQMQIQTDQAKQQGSIMVEKERGRNRIMEAIIKATSDRQIKLTELAVSQKTKMQELERNIGMDNGKLTLDMLKEANRKLDIDTRARELDNKIETGQEGI